MGVWIKKWKKSGLENFSCVTAIFFTFFWGRVKKKVKKMWKNVCDRGLTSLKIIFLSVTAKRFFSLHKWEESLASAERFGRGLAKPLMMGLPWVSFWDGEPRYWQVSHFWLINAAFMQKCAKNSQVTSSYKLQLGSSHIWLVNAKFMQKCAKNSPQIITNNRDQIYNRRQGGLGQWGAWSCDELGHDTGWWVTNLYRELAPLPTVSSNVWNDGRGKGRKALGSSRHFRPDLSLCQLLASVGFQTWLTHPCHSAAATHAPHNLCLWALLVSLGLDVHQALLEACSGARAEANIKLLQ